MGDKKPVYETLEYLYGYEAGRASAFNIAYSKLIEFMNNKKEMITMNEKCELCSKEFELGEIYYFSEMKDTAICVECYESFSEVYDSEK